MRRDLWLRIHLADGLRAGRELAEQPENGEHAEQAGKTRRCWKRSVGQPPQGCVRRCVRGGHIGQAEELMAGTELSTELF